jgi:hypothetical protein
MCKKQILSKRGTPSWSWMCKKRILFLKKVALQFNIKSKLLNAKHFPPHLFLAPAPARTTRSNKKMIPQRQHPHLLAAAGDRGAEGGMLPLHAVPKTGGYTD